MPARQFFAAFGHRAVSGQKPYGAGERKGGKQWHYVKDGELPPFP